ncbi:MAG: ATPase, partial [Solobacterium sp.]|nr:ATPase [Solobacterium sp.]
GKWNGTNGSGWVVSEDNYKKYIKPKEVYMLIHNIDKKELSKLSEIEQVKLASFVLNYESNKKYEVTEQMAKKLVNEWKLESVDEI